MAGLPRALDQAQAAEAGVALLADDDVVVDQDPERLGRGHDLPGHLDIGAGGVWGRLTDDCAPVRWPWPTARAPA